MRETSSRIARGACPSPARAYPMVGRCFGRPDHCVQATDRAKLHPELDIPHAELIIREAFRQNVDSYSAFLEADRKTTTGLAGYLKERGLRRVFCAGLATDFCVAWSAVDSRRFGFDARVIEDACRAIDAQGSLEAAWKDMLAAEVERVRSERLDFV